MTSYGVMLCFLSKGLWFREIWERSVKTIDARRRIKFMTFAEGVTQKEHIEHVFR